MVTYFQPKHWWKSVGLFQRNSADVHLHSGICGIRLEEHFHTCWGEHHVVARRCFASRQICLIYCTGHNCVPGDLHRNDIWAPKVGLGGCTKPTFFACVGLGYCYREVCFSWHYILKLPYIFKIKVSLVLL